MEDTLTKEEMEQIIKVMVVYNSGTVKFDTGFLNCMNNFDMVIKREDKKLTLSTKLPWDYKNVQN